MEISGRGFRRATTLLEAARHAPQPWCENEDFSRDPKAVAAPLTAHEVQPAITVAALVRADERLRKSFQEIEVPVLIMHGTEDKATVCHGSEFFYEHVGSEDRPSTCTRATITTCSTTSTRKR